MALTAQSRVDAEPRVSLKIKKSQSSKHISLCIESNKESLKTQCKSSEGECANKGLAYSIYMHICMYIYILDLFAGKEGSLRYGAMLQMLLRVSPFKSCARHKAMPPDGT